MTALQDLVKGFAGLRIAVLGDLVIDEYIMASPSRISREAPVLIVREEERDVRLGSAGNVVANIRAMGGTPLPLGLVGADDVGEQLLELLASQGISTEGVLVDPVRLTSTKTRVLGGEKNTVRQQMIRIDRLTEDPVGSTIRLNLVEHLRRAIEVADALVVSDYGEGVVEAEVFEEVLRIIGAGEKPVFVDSRYRIDHFRHADTLMPNEPELWSVSKLDVASDTGIEQAARRLLQSTECTALVVKRGRKGMALVQKDAPIFKVKAFGPKEVADRIGAGDTVLAAYTLARCAGASPEDAVVTANTSGGIKVTKSGTAVVAADELARALGQVG